MRVLLDRKSRRAEEQKGFCSNLLLYCSIALLLCFALQTVALADEKWTGVDESVVEKYAKEHGREAREPFINTDQGDLLLFVFLIAGVVGGFTAGYYWRVLVEERKCGRAEVQKNFRTN